VRASSALIVLLVLACAPDPVGGGDDDGLLHGGKDAGHPADLGGADGLIDGGTYDAGAAPDPDAGAIPVEDAGGPVDPTAGFIGGSCAEDADCAYEGGVCRTSVEGGACTQACDQFCPDQDGAPVTFCVDDASLPSELAGLGDGACVSRCDTGLFPQGGCRAGYGCVVAPRANDLEVERYVCLPGMVSELSDCQLELAALGVPFEPTIRADESPDGSTSVCHIEDPVILHPPIHGVDLAYYDGSATPNVLAACGMAVSLVQTIDDVAAEGVTRVRHFGTYNCRTIAGSENLSRHAYGDAIDLYGFDWDDGTSYTVLDDYEDGVDDPQTPGGRFLYDASHRWFDAGLWNIVLTPNYNAAHDNHFHVDLTPSSHFMTYGDLRYFGVSTTND
jgi:hypothetical protein